MKTVRRLAILGAAIFAVCAVFWAAVDTFGPAPKHWGRRDSWAKPHLSDAPQRVGGQLLIIAAVAFAGRKVLRLKL